MNTHPVKRTIEIGANSGQGRQSHVAAERAPHGSIKPLDRIEGDKDLFRAVDHLGRIAVAVVKLFLRRVYSAGPTRPIRIKRCLGPQCDDCRTRCSDGKGRRRIRPPPPPP